MIKSQVYCFFTHSVDVQLVRDRAIRGSAIIERLRGVLCLLKSCQLLHQCTKTHTSKSLQYLNDLEGHSMSLEITLADSDGQNEIMIWFKYD